MVLGSIACTGGQQGDHHRGHDSHDHAISEDNPDIKMAQFDVNGNCGMCKTRIETAAKSVKGIVSAEWDNKTKMVEIAFNDSETDLNNIHMAIARAGHDTEMHRANEEAYDNLHACCKYERE